MLFEDWELNIIVESLENNGNLMSDMIINKISRLQSNSNIKRYSLRSTDWLSEAGKKRNRRKVNDRENLF